MKIFIVEPRGNGGMIHYAYQLCNAMAGQGEQVTLVTANEYELDGYPHNFRVEKFLRLWSRADPLQNMPSRNPIEVMIRKSLRGLRRVYRGIRLVLEWFRLIDYLSRSKPDIIQFGSIEFPFEALFLKYLKDRGFALSQISHEFEPREVSNRIQITLNRYLLGSVFKSFSTIFFHSHSNQERFQQLYPEISSDRFHIIPMGNGQIFPALKDEETHRKILNARYGLRKEDQVVLFFGNITPSKGVPDLLRAFSQVYEVNKHARLVVAGKPLKYMDMDALIELAASLDIQGVTHFELRYLPMEEVAPLIGLADIVVYPYVSSTQSGSIQVAYAFGKPVVATRVGGLPDVVEDGVTGYLVAPCSPEELSGAILKILGDPALAARMGRNAKKISETRFAWEPIAAQILSVYRSLRLLERE